VLVRLATWVERRGRHAFGSDHKLALSQRHGRKPDVTGLVIDLDALFHAVDRLERPKPRKRR
jgi:hypothetical protein